MAKNLRKKILYFVPYVLVNGFGFAIDLALLYFQAEILGITYAIAIVSSYVIAVVITHAILYRFIFTLSARTYLESGRWYIVISSLRLTIITGVTLVLTNVLFFGLLPARVVAATLDSAVFFIVDFGFTFRERMKVPKVKSK